MKNVNNAALFSSAGDPAGFEYSAFPSFRGLSHIRNICPKAPSGAGKLHICLPGGTGHQEQQVQHI